MDTCLCKQCDHTWYKRTPKDPIYCPLCHSQIWKQDIIKRNFTHKNIRSDYFYNCKTGQFIRKKDWKEIGWVSGNGHMQVSVFGETYLLHRLIWFYMKGYFPEYIIEHKNDIKTDNRWKNLKESTQSCNMKNKKVSPKSETGIPGVIILCNKKFLASCNGESMVFEQIAEAICYRFALEQCYGWDKCGSNSEASQYIKNVIQKRRR